MNIGENPELLLRRDRAFRLLESLIEVPAEMTLASTAFRKHDDECVFVFRFEKCTGECSGIGGEHFSVSIDMNATRVLGYMHADRIHTGAGLPDEASAKQRATEVMARLAPDLVEKFELKWVLTLLDEPKSPPRDSPFAMWDDGGTRHLLTGVRVKYHVPSSGKWAWVIVGRQGRVLSFERDVIWSSVLGHRSTEAWLHDEYVLGLTQELRDQKLHRSRGPCARARSEVEGR